MINGGLISKWFEQFRIPGTIFRGSGKHTVENGFMVQVRVGVSLLLSCLYTKPRSRRYRNQADDLLSYALDFYSRNFPN